MAKPKKPKMTLEEFFVEYKKLFEFGWRAYWGTVEKREAKPIWLTPLPQIVYRAKDYKRIWIFCPLSAVSAQLEGPIVHRGISGVVRRFLKMESSLAQQILDEGDGVMVGPIREKLIKLSVFDTYHQPMTLRHMP